MIYPINPNGLQKLGKVVKYLSDIAERREELLNQQNKNKKNSIVNVHKDYRQWKRHAMLENDSDKFSDEDNMPVGNEFEFQEEFELDCRQRANDLQSYANQHMRKY